MERKGKARERKRRESEREKERGSQRAGRVSREKYQTANRKDEDRKESEYVNDEATELRK